MSYMSEYMSEIFSTFSENNYFDNSSLFRGMLSVSFWTGWKRRTMSSLWPELRLIPSNAFNHNLFHNQVRTETYNFFSGASLDDRPKAFEPDQVSESYCWQKLKIWFRRKTIIDLKLLFSEVESWKCKTEDELPPPPCPRFVCFLNAFLNWKS